MTDKLPKIVDALRKLDTTNDAHWTTDGLPRLETVKFLAGDQSLTRDDVTSAVAGFTRTNTTVPDLESADGVVSPNDDGSINIEGARDIGAGGHLEGVDANGALSGHTEQETLGLAAGPAPSTEEVAAEGEEGAAPTEGEDFPSGENPEAESNQVEDFVHNDPDETSGLQADLEAAEARIADLMEDRDTVNRLLVEANVDADRIRDAITTARGSSNTTNVILQALESRKQQAESRGQVQASLRASGVDLKALAKAASRAPIDQAMARKTGRGGARPAHR